MVDGSVPAQDYFCVKSDKYPISNIEPLSRLFFFVFLRVQYVAKIMLALFDPLGSTPIVTIDSSDMFVIFLKIFTAIRA